MYCTNRKHETGSIETPDLSKENNFKKLKKTRLQEKLITAQMNKLHLS